MSTTTVTRIRNRDFGIGRSRHKRVRRNDTVYSRYTFPRKYLNGYKAPHAFYLRQVLILSTNAGGVMANTISNNVATIPEFSDIQALFDSYKVTGVKLHYQPHLPNDTSVTTGYTPLYIVNDPDSPSALLGSVAQAIEYDSLKVRNLFRPWKVYYKYPKITQVPSGSAIVLSNGWLDIDNPIGTSSVATYADGLDISTTYGELIITYYVKCKNRK